MLFQDVITDVALGQQNRSVLAFYIKRLGRENSRRTVAVVLGGLLIGLQVFMMVQPPKISPLSSGRKPDDISMDRQSNAGQLTYLHTAVNMTRLDNNQQPTNAAGAEVRAGDRIRYTLAVRNVGDTEYKDFVFEENLTDVLEYADVVDAGGSQLERASDSTDQTKQLKWEATSIAPQELVSRSYTVAIKRPIPTYAVGQLNPGSYDLVAESNFGENPVRLAVAAPLAKRLEGLSRRLPLVPSGVVLAGLVIWEVGMIGIWLRTRIIRRELAIMATTGGHPR